MCDIKATGVAQSVTASLSRQRFNMRCHGSSLKVKKRLILLSQVRHGCHGFFCHGNLSRPIVES